jgi:hypothetical protein
LASQLPIRPPPQIIIINININKEDFLMESSPTRLAVYVVGLDIKEDKGMDKVPNDNNKPLKTDL